jgi:hypothetical protein
LKRKSTSENPEYQANASLHYSSGDRILQKQMGMNCNITASKDDIHFFRLGYLAFSENRP